MHCFVRNLYHPGDDAVTLPFILITRTSPFPAWEVGAHRHDGRIVRRFKRDADLMAFLGRNRYEMVAPDTWRKA